MIPARKLSKTTLVKELAIRFPSLTESRACLLLKPSPTWLIEGLGVEGSRFPGKLKVWAVRYPVWTVVIGGYNLSYSNALNYGQFFDGSLEQAVDTIVTQVEASPVLASLVRGPEMDLALFRKMCFPSLDWKQTPLLLKLRDLAFVSALVGDYNLALDAVTRFLSLPSTVKLKDLADNLRTCLINGPDQARIEALFKEHLALLSDVLS